MNAIPPGHEAVMAAIEAAANSYQPAEPPVESTPRAVLEFGAESEAKPGDPFSFPESFCLPEPVGEGTGHCEAVAI